MAELKKIAKKPTFENFFIVLGFLTGLIICHINLFIHFLTFKDYSDTFSIIIVFIFYGSVVAIIGLFVGRYLDKIVNNIINELATKIKG